jgi:hypothetical protein
MTRQLPRRPESLSFASVSERSLGSGSGVTSFWKCSGPDGLGGAVGGVAGCVEGPALGYWPQLGVDGRPVRGVPAWESGCKKRAAESQKKAAGAEAILIAEDVESVLSLLVGHLRGHPWASNVTRASDALGDRGWCQLRGHPLVSYKGTPPARRKVARICEWSASRMGRRGR